MAFGQSSGSPATARQIQELLTLLQEAGHASFRDARGPMGFNQRQAGGKFSRDECSAFIEQLQREADDEAVAGGPPPPVAEAPAPKPKPVRRYTANGSLSDVPSAELAAELQRRGWIVVEP
jgi:hypothetical protein